MTIRFSSEERFLLVLATNLEKIIPKMWEISVFEKVHLIAEQLRRCVPLALTVQSGSLGTADHTWMWVGKPPERISCEYPECSWEAVYECSNLYEHSGHASADLSPDRADYCQQHSNIEVTKNPLQRKATVLDITYPGSLPPVVLLKPPLLSLYCPGPALLLPGSMKIRMLRSLFNEARPHLIRACSKRHVDAGFEGEPEQ